MSEPTSILVVDDEEGIRNYLKTLLKLKGYEVSTVASGSEALEYFKSCSLFRLGGRSIELVWSG